MSCAAKTFSFDLCTLDGITAPIDTVICRDMWSWLDEQGITASITVEEHHLLLEYYTCKFLRVTIADPDHAMWFKMRWNQDVVSWEREKEAHSARQLRKLKAYSASLEEVRKAEDERILSEMLAMVPHGQA